MKRRNIAIVIVLAIGLILGFLYLQQRGENRSASEGRHQEFAGEEVGANSKGELSGKANGSTSRTESTGVSENTASETTDSSDAASGNEAIDAALDLANSPYSVSVRVLDAEDEGLAVPVVFFRLQVREIPAGSDTTADDGTLSHKLPAAGEYVVEADWQGTLLRSTFEVTEAAPATEVQLQYAGAGVIFGRVIATVGELVDDVRGAEKALGEQELAVEAILDSGEEISAQAPHCNVNEDGEYRIQGLIAGKYMLRIRMKFHVEELELGDGEQLSHDIHLGRGRVSGRVFDQASGGTAENTQVVIRMVSYEEGNAELMAKAQLDLISDRLQPDVDGSYAFSNLPTGEYTIFANGHGYGVSKRSITISSENDDIVVDFEMQPGAAIQLAIQDLQGVDLKVPRASTQGLTWGFTGTVGGLSAGTFDVAGSAEGYEIQIRPDVVFTSEKPVEVTFKLERAASTRVLFVDPNGKPVSDVRVSVPLQGHDIQELSDRMVRGSTLPFTKTNSEGWVQVLGLKAGKCHIVAKCPGYAQFEGTVMLDPEVPERTIALTPSEGSSVFRIQVTGVTPDGQAQRAGIAVGDLILVYNGVEIDSKARLVEAIATAKSSGLSFVEATIETDGQPRVVGFQAGVLGVTLKEIESARVPGAD